MTAPTGYETRTPHDENARKLPQSMYSTLCFQGITECLKPVQTGQTRRDVIGALRGPTINLPRLANRVELVSNPTPTRRDVVPAGMTPLNYDWSNSVSLSFQLQSLWPALPLTPLVMWSRPIKVREIIIQVCDVIHRRHTADTGTSNLTCRNTSREIY